MVKIGLSLSGTIELPPYLFMLLFIFKTTSCLNLLVDPRTIRLTFKAYLRLSMKLCQNAAKSCQQIGQGDNMVLGSPSTF